MMETKDSEQNICRTCLTLGANNSIFSIHKATSLSYLDILCSCTSVQVNAEDDLPKQMCHKCLETVVSFFLFKKSVIENDLKLKQIWEIRTQCAESDIKLEDNIITKLSPKSELESVEKQESCVEKESVDEPPVNVNYMEIESIRTSEKSIDFEDDAKHLDKTRDDEENDINTNGSSQCNVCGKIISKKSLTRHSRRHTGEKPYTCDVCGKNFGRSEHLINHKRTHTGEKPYCCTVCQKSFRQRAALTAHTYIHNDECPFICYVCGKSFKYSTSLLRHKEVHSKETPHSCTICKKSFKNSAYLRVHMRFHSDDKPFSCKVCDKRYFTKSNLNVHMKRHDNILSASCVICGKGFVRPQHLKLHLISHTGEKAHSCELCSKKFTQQSHLNRHLKVLHGRTK